MHNMGGHPPRTSRGCGFIFLKEERRRFYVLRNPSGLAYKDSSQRLGSHRAFGHPDLGSEVNLPKVLYSTTLDGYLESGLLFVAVVFVESWMVTYRAFESWMPDVQDRMTVDHPVVRDRGLDLLGPVQHLVCHDDDLLREPARHDARRAIWDIWDIWDRA